MSSWLITFLSNMLPSEAYTIAITNKLSSAAASTTLYASIFSETYLMQHIFWWTVTKFTTSTSSFISYQYCHRLQQLFFSANNGIKFIARHRWHKIDGDRGGGRKTEIMTKLDKEANCQTSFPSYWYVEWVEHCNKYFTSPIYLK